MQPISHKRKIRCQSSRETIWRALADTDRMNRFLGNPPLTVRRREGDGLARYEMTTRMGGLNTTYDEPPYEWQQGKTFSVFRVMRNSPAAQFRMQWLIEDRTDSPGCDASLTLEVTPRNVLVQPVVWLASWRGAGDLERYVRFADEQIAKESGAGKPVLTPVTVPADRVRKAQEQLSSKHDPALVSRLVSFLTQSDETELISIRPFALADGWKEDRTRVLRMCLDAVPAGLLEMSWAILCPSCRTASDVIPSLSELTEGGHCHTCDISWGVDLDRAVEARFTPHPSILRVETRPFCVAGPGFTPHVIAQFNLLPKHSLSIELPTQPGRYRLFARGGPTALLVIDPTSTETNATVSVGETVMEPSQLVLPPNSSLRVTDTFGEGDGRHIKLEHGEWQSAAATAHHVTALPEFRATFGSQALRPGLALKVARVAVLFSDLCGSTALYSRLGDAGAFGLVTDSFTHCNRFIDTHRGVVVKTMGDAILAVFTEPEESVLAAAEMLKTWSEFQSGHENAEHLDIKIGIYTGPCTVVTANQVIDYFGQTVNTASRVQHIAGPRELIVPREMFSEDAIPEGLKLVEYFSTTVKGIEEPLQLVRLTVA